MSAIAIIPARSGSVRLPGKNIKPFHGRPIIAYSIETAQASGLFSLVVVSTDAMDIAAVAFNCGAAVMWRATDDGVKGTQEVAGDVLRQMPGIQKACVIYPCAPLVIVDDLKRAAYAVNETTQFAFGVGADPLADAGAFYFGMAGAFAANRPLIGPNTAMIPLPPGRVCDINTQADFDLALRLYTEMRA